MRDKQHNYSILEAETGEEALLCCRQQFPDAILLDYWLPDMNGLEFLNRLKTQSGQTKLPVIILEERENLEIAVKMMKSGAADCLVKKNLKPENLYFAIDNVLKKQLTIVLGDRKQAEETLQIYASELEELYYHAPCGYHSLDTDGIVIRINDTELDMLGYSREEVIGKKNFSDLLTHESLPIFQKNFPRFKQRGWIRDLEFQMVRKDGTILPISLSATAIEDTASNHLFSLCVVVDISDRQAALRESQRAEEALRQARDELETKVRERTAELVQVNARLQEEIKERQQAEVTVQESERRLSTLMNNLPGYVYRVANNLNYTPEFISKGVFAISEYHQEEYLVDRTVSCGQDIHPDDTEWVWNVVQQAIAARQPYECEYRIITKSGNQKWVWERGQGIYTESGELLFLEGFVTDISARKQAQEKIREQAALLDIASDAIFVRDLQHQILYWNSGAERLYGWTAAEAIDHKANELFCQKIAPQMERILQTVLESGSWQGELLKVTKSGTEAIVNSRMTLVRDEAGQPKSILTVDTDITEKKQFEKQFYQAQRLESLGTLASGISHDMNNILTPIMAAAHLLPLKLPSLDRQNQRLLKILTDNAKRGAELVKQILSFARGDEEEQILLQPKYSLEETERIVKETFPKSIEIHTNIPKQNLWTISANPTQISQVLMNLCVNARDAMPNAGILTISAENRWFDDNYARMNWDAKVGNYVVITVSDTGCGMSQEVKERIFEPFFTTKESDKGTGLGLSTVIGIVKNHGGFVNVYSEVGKGSQFQVCFPASDAAATQVDSDSEIVRGNGELILVVDDETPIREITKISLVNHNYKVLTACDGVEAFSLYDRHKDEIVLVLMDMQMPSISGFNAIRVLKKMNPSIKIIAISGLASNRKLLEDLGLDVQAFLSKPYTIKELLDTIQDVL
jgi:PAS domain S-box-containing protein